MLLARNEELNQWLSENPLVLGGIAVALGFLLLGFGVRDLMTGKARTKWGGEVTGGTAAVYGVVRVVAGAAATLFGLFWLAKGFMG